MGRPFSPTFELKFAGNRIIEEFSLKPVSYLFILRLHLCWMCRPKKEMIKVAKKSLSLSLSRVCELQIVYKEEELVFWDC